MFIVYPARERAYSADSPRHHAIKTGSLMAEYHWGMRKKTNFSRSAAQSLTGQSIEMDFILTII
jgi:hypothetical protein